MQIKICKKDPDGTLMETIHDVKRHNYTENAGPVSFSCDISERSFFTGGVLSQFVPPRGVDSLPANLLDRKDPTETPAGPLPASHDPGQPLWMMKVFLLLIFVFF